MATYKAKTQIWLSNDCRMVQPGEEFEAEFPIGYQSERIETVYDPRVEALEKAKAEAVEKAKAEAETKTNELVPELFDVDDKKTGTKLK